MDLSLVGAKETPPKLFKVLVDGPPRLNINWVAKNMKDLLRLDDRLG